MRAQKNTRKVRVSATIRRELAAVLDRAGKNRSAVLESILEKWVEEERRRNLDRETARYYKRYADAESREEGDWVDRVSAILTRASDDEPD